MFNTTKKKDQNNEESLWEIIEQKVKYWLHSLMHELLESQVSSPLVFNILCLMETLQFNYYAIHPILNGYIWDTNFLDYYRSVVQYFQLNYVLRNSSSSTFLAALYICFSANLIIIILIIFTTVKIVKHEKKTSTLLSYCIKFLSSQALLMNTVYSMPIFNSFLTTVICNKNSPYTLNMTCYSGIHFLHLIVAIFGLIFVAFLSLLFAYLYIDINPTSVIPFAQPQSIMPLLKLSLKILLPFYVTIDYNGTFLKQYIVVLTFFNLVILFYRFLSPPYFNKKVQSFVVFCEAYLFWVSLCALITTFLDEGTTDNIGLLYLAICMPMLWNVYRSIVNFRQSMYIQLSTKDFKKDEQVETYVMTLIELIENRENADSRILLEGILKYHSKECPKEDCHCHVLLLDETKEEDQAVLSRKWYLFVKSILEFALEKFVKSARLHLLHSYVQHEKLKNKFKALFELMIAKEQKPSIQEDFAIYRFANQIELEIKENDEKTGDSRNVDVNKIVLFQKRFIDFQTGIDKSVYLHLDFWKELLEENPEIQKIENMGSKITSTVEQVREQFYKLREIYSNHIKCLEIYGYFLKDIVNDDIEGEKILDNVKYAKNSQSINKQFVDQDRLKYGENSNTAILTVSGNYGEIGAITNLNNEITRILGWNKVDVMDQNISRIMPKVYADIHDKLMENYLQTSEGTVIGIERTVLCLNKVLPNLEEGIQIVGFLKDIENISGTPGDTKGDDAGMENTYYMIYRTDNDSFALQGVTENCFTSFGIPAQLMYGNNSNNVEFTVDTICPELLNPDHYEELRSPAGFRLTLDTTTVQQNFLLDEDESDEEDMDQQVIDEPSHSGNNVDGDDGQDRGQKTRKYRYKKVEVRMHLIEEQTLEDRKICVVRFVEVDENDDGKSKINPEQLMSSNVDQNNQRDYERNQMVKKQWRNQQQQIAQQQQHDEEFMASEGGSNLSNSSLNDEVRQLKDFKSLISEKTVPQSIKVLQRTVLSVIVIILTLAAVELGLKISEDSSIMTGVNSIFTAFQRPDIMADVNFYVRRVSNIANSIRLPASGSTVTTEFLSNQNYLAINVDLFQTNQFANMKNLISLDGSTQTALSSALYDVKFQQQTKTDIRSYSNLLTDAMIQLITSASSLANSTQTSFIDTGATYVDSTLKNFYYVVTNGLFVLRKGAEYEADEFYSYYYDKMDSYETRFKIIMSFGIVFIALSLVILIPYVFKVHKTNNRVLSLFGMIPLAEIKKLASRCEAYSVQFIDERKTQGDLNKEDEEEDEDQDGNHQDSNPDDKENEQKNIHSNIEIDGENNDGDEVKLTEGDPKQHGANLSKKEPHNEVQLHLNGKNQLSKIQNQSKENLAVPSNNPQQQSHLSAVSGAAIPGGQAPDSKPLAGNKQPVPGKPNAPKDKTAEEEEAENIRTKKLMNTKDNNRKKVMIQFGVFALVFMIYFVIGLVLELSFLQSMRQVMNHLNLVSQRNAIIKYVLVFMVEQISTDTIQLQGGEDNLTKFINMSYTVENEINSSSLQSYPSQFSTYFSDFSTANYNNFCTIFPATTDLTQATCATVNQQMLQKGLKVSITAYIEDIRNMITDYVNAGVTTKTAKNTLFAKTKYVDLELMQFYMVPMIETLNLELMDGIQSFLNNQDLIEEIKFGVFVGALVIVFLLIWLPYLSSLSQKIWRTKGMLNMIPMDIITKDANLKAAFVSGDILQAVK